MSLEDLMGDDDSCGYVVICCCSVVIIHVLKLFSNPVVISREKGFFD